MDRTNTDFRLPFLFLGFFTLVCFLINISFGSVYIPFSQTISVFTGSSEVEVWNVIVMDYRLPKAITAILVGSGLGISGLLHYNKHSMPSRRSSSQGFALALS